MPNLDQIVHEKHVEAVKLIENEISSKLGARSLSDAEISQIYNKVDISAVWQFTCEIRSKEIDVNLIIPVDFPYNPPKVGVASPPAFLEFPHIDEDGVLCSQPLSSTYSSETPVDTTNIILRDAIKLLDDNLNGRTTQDLQDEFLSYWSRTLDDSKLPTISLVNPAGPHRIIRIRKGYLSIVGEDEKSIKTWLKHRYGKNFDDFEEALLVWLPEPLFPKEYPKNTYDLVKIVASKAPEAAPLLRALAVKSPGRLFVLLGSDTKNGPCLAGVTLHSPKKGNSKYHSSRSTLEDGFRKGHVPTKIISERFLLAGNPLTRYEIERADPAWVHSRSENPLQKEISAKRVVVIGCGSIGSLVAKYMAAAGVGNLLVIDPERLSRTNTGRHFLGAKSANLSKAEILGKTLQEDYPHLEVEFKNSSWQVVARNEAQKLDDADLIISTTGNWASDSQLNEWQLANEDAPPILYGWTEAFALAGHAVLIVNDRANGCIRCGKDHTGSANLQVCSFATDTILNEPACGVTYQPYGYIEVSHTISLIAEMAVEALMGKIVSSTERVRAAKRSKVLEAGGQWTDEWVDLARENNGEQIVERGWSKVPCCPICGHAT